MIAVLEAYRAGLLQRRHWLPNIISGVVVGIVALPLAMAFAIASGAKPEQGLYTAIVAGVVVSLFGGSRVQIAGPTGAFVVLLAGVTASHGIDGLQIATLMAGVMLLLFGIARLGAIIRFIPDPVIVGFTTGIAVIIFVGQWPYFFGFTATPVDHFHERIWLLVQRLPDLHLGTVALGIMALALIVITPRVPRLRRLPGPLVALVAVTGLHAVIGFEGVATLGTAFGGIPAGLPALHWPQMTLPMVIELIGPAFAIAMLGAIESLLSAVVADGMAATRHDSNQELIGQGLANIVAPLFGGFAATGAIARTATNVRSGGNSPLSGVVHALTLALVLVSLAPLAAHIPLSLLAAILFVVAWNMSEARHFIKMAVRAPRADVVILLVTFSLTVFADLVIAVNIGVILAILQFLRRMASSVEVAQVTEQQLAQEFAHRGIARLPPGVLVYSVEGPFFFAAAEKFERALAATHTDPSVLVIRLRWVPFMDVTGLQTLEEIVLDLQRRGVRVMLTGANPRVEAKLRRAGIIDLVGDGNFLPSLADALAQWLDADPSPTGQPTPGEPDPDSPSASAQERP
ncbi:MAG: sulfate permease [Pseudomonadales bacterium]